MGTRRRIANNPLKGFESEDYVTILPNGCYGGFQEIPEGEKQIKRIYGFIRKVEKKRKKK